jgi:hypothetical protein
MKKYPTQRQKWARERNWNKAQLITIDAAIRRIINSHSTIDHERSKLDNIQRSLSSLLYYFKENENISRMIFLVKGE